MKKPKKRSILSDVAKISFLIFMCFETYAQQVPNVMVRTAATIKAFNDSVKKDEDKLMTSKPDITPGTELQGGLGNFGDPSTHHGFALSLNGSLGVSKKINTFGYDAFSVNSRWVPGTNKLGRRIIIQFGAGNWFTPALNTVYKDTVLTSDEKKAESKTVNNIMAGLAFQLSNSREFEGIVFTKEIQEKLRDLNLELIKAIGEIEKEKVRKQIETYMWNTVKNQSLRKFSWIVGGMFRLGSLGNETDITAADLFTTIAKGKGIFDAVFSYHHLLPLKDELVAKNAHTFNLGFFFDLDNNPPVNTMGLTLGYGRYNYLEKERKIEGVSTILSDQPSTDRFDATLSFSGLFKDLGPFGSSIGFRYSYLSNSSTKNESQFAVLFTTKFVNSRQ